MSELKDGVYINTDTWTLEDGTPLPDLIIDDKVAVSTDSGRSSDPNTSYAYDLDRRQLFHITPNNGETFTLISHRVYKDNKGKPITTAALQTLRGWKKGESRKQSSCIPAYYTSTVACQHITETMINRAIVAGFLRASFTRGDRTVGILRDFGELKASNIHCDTILTRTDKQIPTVKYRKSAKKSIWTWTEREHWDRVSSSRIQTVRTGLVEMSKNVTGHVQSHRVNTIDSKLPTVKVQADFKKFRQHFQHLRGIDATNGKPLTTTLVRDPADATWDVLRSAYNSLSAKTHRTSNFKCTYLSTPAALVKSILMMTAAPTVIDNQVVIIPVEDSLQDIPCDFKPVKKYICANNNEGNRVSIGNMTSMFFVYLNENHIISNDVFDNWMTMNSYEYSTPLRRAASVNYINYKQYKFSDSVVYCSEIDPR